MLESGPLREHGCYHRRVHRVRNPEEEVDDNKDKAISDGPKGLRTYVSSVHEKSGYTERLDLTPGR